MLRLIVACLALSVAAGCTNLSLGPEPDANAICEALQSASGDQQWQVLDDNQTSVQAVVRALGQRAAGASNKKLVVLLDGTGNTKKTATNVWKLYSLATRHGCGEAAVVPYYHRGVGTAAAERLIGGITGHGIESMLKRAYSFLAEHYDDGDEIYIFGFSRGAYAARSLNGIVEYAGLLRGAALSRGELRQQVNRIYAAYRRPNDGRPGWERYLRELIEQETADLEFHRSRQGKSCDKDHVCVEAIGVFDTVPALGWGRDDYPDDHRTALYAEHGYHALSLDEQRDDFRPLRLVRGAAHNRQLEEMWFPGAHADVGGGYCDSRGLERVSRRWMMAKFRPFELFPPDDGLSCDAGEPHCELGQLHDAFIDAFGTFGAFGLHWRRPGAGDILHGSIACRAGAGELPDPHEGREACGVYAPQNVVANLEGYTISAETGFECLGGAEPPPVEIKSCWPQIRTTKSKVVTCK